MRWILALLLLGVAAAAHAGGPKKDAKPVQVPYRLTDTHHVLVRAKINGKGPFNFIVDTGCPVLLVSTPVGKQIGLGTDSKGWAVIDKFELEGGLTQEQVKVRVETPFQFEGMNSMGLPGVELHGLLGYTAIAKYKMEFDFTKDQMTWVPLAFDPPPPQALGGKVPTGGLEAIAGLMKIMSALAGIKPAPPPQPRGFLGFEVEEKDGKVLVTRVLAASPAAEAGLKPGDAVRKLEGKDVTSVEQLVRASARYTPGGRVALVVGRGEESQELTLTAIKGF